MSKFKEVNTLQCLRCKLTGFNYIVISGEPWLRCISCGLTFTPPNENRPIEMFQYDEAPIQ